MVNLSNKLTRATVGATKKMAWLIRKSQSVFLFLGVMLISPWVWAGIPTPPASLQMSGDQDLVGSTATVFSKEVVPLTLAVLGFIVLVVGVWVLIRGLLEVDKTGNTGGLKIRGIAAAVSIVLAGVLIYAANNVGSGLSISA